MDDVFCVFGVWRSFGGYGDYRRVKKGKEPFQNRITAYAALELDERERERERVKGQAGACRGVARTERRASKQQPRSGRERCE